MKHSGRGRIKTAALIGAAFLAVVAGTQATDEVETRSTRDRTIQPGNVAITYHLDANKLNRINAHRDAKLIGEYPDLFGENKEFRPLMTVRAYGPGKLTIFGDPATGSLVIPVGTGGEKVEIYPHYKLEELAREGELKEQITVQWKDEISERTVDSRSLPWSSKHEFFLSPTRFGDLAALAWGHGKPWKTREDCPRLLQNLGKLNIQYEVPSVTEGWQRVRTIEEVVREKKANCLDLTVWIAGNSAHSGWLSKIYILGNHSMPGFGSASSPLILETTALVESKEAGKARDIEQALEEGKANYNKGLQKGAREIDLDGWRSFYRYPKNGRNN